METIMERQWLVPIAVVLVSVGLGFLLRAVIVRRLAALFARTATDLDDLVLAATKRYLPFWVFLGGVVIATRIAPLAEKGVRIIDRLCMVSLVISVSFALANLLIGIVGRQTKQAGATVGTTTLVQNVLRVTILALAGLLVLTNLGVSITPLLTALGVGSLAVALALQPTLSNLFAGLHIALARPIRVGDFVGLESGTQGYVVDIGWRATRIRELPNNIIVVPNSRVSEMILTNYAMPEPNQSVLVQVGVAYGSDLAKVEEVTCDVARNVLREVQGGDSEFAPFIRYHTFGDSSIDFTVILRVREFVDRYLVTHEFIKKLKSRFDSEGIEIPFPQRVLHGYVSGAASPPAPAGSPGLRPQNGR
jgi:small-conductance mechanosensitive channel